MNTCEIEGCDSPNLARQMCSKHYARWRRTGSATEMKRIVGGTVVDRLRHRTIEKDGCWLFQGAVTHRDYGDGNNYRGIRLEGGGAYVAAHIAAYTNLVGPIPKGMEVHHLCEQKACWRPKHLVLLTDAEHNRIHHARQDGTCRNGHDMTPDNSYRRKDGYVECRSCVRESREKNRDERNARRRERYAAGLRNV
jgi:hypothetical protein